MTNPLPIKFNIRVYGIFSNEKGEILISDEYQLDTHMTKFPGGGLHFGEGTIDCLKREMMEECGQEIEHIEHFYTTDFYQQALFFDLEQLISIYYTGTLKEPVKFKLSTEPLNFEVHENGSQSFRWLPISEIDPDIFTFPIDKHVAGLLKERNKTIKR